MRLNVTGRAILQLKISSKDKKLKNPPEVMNIKEIAKVRSILIKEKNFRELLTFELIFIFGLTEKQLLLCTSENYDSQKKSYIIEKRELKLPEYLAKIVEDYPEKIYRKYMGEDSINYKYHIKKLGKKIGRNLKISDVLKTHDILGVKCPFCEDIYPVESELWDMYEIKEEYSKSYWLICKQCARIREEQS